MEACCYFVAQNILKKLTKFVPDENLVFYAKPLLLESKKEIEMLQEKILLLSVQRRDKEKETEKLAENIRCKNIK